MRHALLAILATLAAAACDRTLNPEYCLAHPEDVRCGVPDGAIACVDDGECGDQICDTGASPAACVDCTATNVTKCAPTAPICSADNTCRGCTSDAECASDVCLRDGSCAAEAEVVYVTVDGAGMAGCGARDNPCSIMQSIVEVTETRNIIKLAPNAGQDYLVSTGSGLLLNKDVTVIARGASLGRVGSGAVFTVNGGAVVSVAGGVIKGGVGAAGHGIACTGMSVITVLDSDIGPNEADGINATACGVFLERVVIHNNDSGVQLTGGSLEVSRSTFSNNLEGGIVLTGTGTRFAIVNNMFWMNGADASAAGGVLVNTDTSTTSRLEFNSFNANNALSVGTAIECDVPGFVARNNVMFGNGDLSNQEQVGGNCTHTHSIASPGTLPVGAGNVSSDPLFVSAATGNLRTMAGSPTEGAGDPATDLTGLAAIDIDGEPRVAPPDIGVDEHP